MIALQQIAHLIGITRMADVTGLDRIGLPVMAAIRPSSRNVSVSFGKGLTRKAAEVSALMEAAELFYSERGPSAFAARNLMTGHPVSIPWQSVSMDMRGQAPANSATGLAAHTCRDGAVLHGLLEVIERHAHEIWNTSDDDARASTRLELATVKFGPCRTLIDKIEAAGLLVLVWDLAGSLGVPAYLAEIVDPADRAATAYVHGVAASLDPHLALFKALAEAAQVRLTYISGSRDDLDWSDYGPRFDAIVESRLWLIDALKPLRHLPAARPEAARALKPLLHQLRNAVGEIIVAELTGPEAPVCVVKVIVPGLEDLQEFEPPARYPAPRLESALA